ncbi:Hypothetical predicted protein [Olea europaea subsp. europaea]|uniref:Uncharacterized protein n=1 Tax=Olea europaea subsp. europaea TaxID=158383 RepID=A0A8S0S492_OLEEU|nr:Hypothetical predicted protein [Olea europaea subsp. europaea]
MTKVKENMVAKRVPHRKGSSLTHNPVEGQKFQFMPHSVVSIGESESSQLRAVKAQKKRSYAKISTITSLQPTSKRPWAK